MFAVTNPTPHGPIHPTARSNSEGGLVADNSDDEGDEQDYDIRDHWSRFSMGRGRSSSGLKMSGPRRNSNSNSNSSSSSGSRGPFTSYLPASWTQRDPPQIHGLYQNTGKPRKMGSGSHYTTFDPSEGIERRAQMREGESVALLHKEHDRQRWQRTCISSAVFFILGLVVTLYLVWFYRNQYSSSSSSTGSL